MQQRFSHATNMLLNDYISKTIERPLFIDGEERVRTYRKLKNSKKLILLLCREGVKGIDFQNKWVVQLVEEFITGHEGAYGYNDYSNQLKVVKSLMETDEIYRLFEDHYSYDTDALL